MNTRDDLPLSSAALDRLADDGRRVRLWWRDDDARTVTPELERLLELAKRQALPLALAVIPVGAEPALAERLAGASGVSVLLHGHAHANHAPAGEKRAEYGDHRRAEDMSREIAAGRGQLETLFGDRFRPVFVPPWNRIGHTARSMLPGLGLPILSVYGSAKPSGQDGPAEVNTHLDIMDWRAMRSVSVADADRRLADLVAGHGAGHGAVRSTVAGSESEGDGGGEPIGLLTHHLQHDEAAWRLVEVLLGLLAGHPAVTWPDLPAAERHPNAH
ncbi:polysaccharide deacetylase family protein [Jiella pelagia]|uniref:Polysaccharide deacetylase family protein n=1 Tax=Jiella pelagia TaxID=2986949 RepID=A0ABY7C543_9HYPH|nr:polysaccharide deacetylase family protein [Jiella pelagia]WAP70823.1 polysaccharide deacetylase family protein [Jiella pelagia]